MVQFVSTVGTLISNQNRIRQNQEDFNLLTYRVSTGKKFQELKDYGANAVKVVDLRQDVTSRESYVRSIELTEIVTGAYNTALEGIIDGMQDLIDAADPLSTQDPNWAADNAVIADNLMLNLEANLNLDIGGRYLFAGTNYNSAPVKDLRQLSLYTTNDLPPTAGNTIEGANQIPQHTVDAGGTNTVESYHNSFTASGTIDANAWKQVEISVSDHQTITYGITATDDAFQNTVEALLRFKSATQSGLTEDQRKQFLSDARTIADTARTQLRQLQTTNGVVINELQDTKDLHTNFINNSQINLDGLTNVDPAAAATELSALQTLIQSSYAAISRQSQLSLVNFL
ncbi:flagellin [Aestuariispira ectoiniformans]|uniref:flagellin n=1 Tax=Aestuariispira ectoiniformans TaxID=2775080 RepID=UPI00223AB6F6|nr:flagellin [Aestuariispira ectoiniformans]